MVECEAKSTLTEHRLGGVRGAHSTDLRNTLNRSLAAAAPASFCMAQTWAQNEWRALVWPVAKASKQQLVEISKHTSDTRNQQSNYA